MNDELDARLRSGLAALAEFGDPDGAPERVRERIGRRKRRRQRIVAISVAGTVAILGAAVFVGGTQSSENVADRTRVSTTVPGGGDTRPNGPSETSPGGAIPTTVATTNTAPDGAPPSTVTPAGGTVPRQSTPSTARPSTASSTTRPAPPTTSRTPPTTSRTPPTTRPSPPTTRPNPPTTPRPTSPPTTNPPPPTTNPPPSTTNPRNPTTTLAPPSGRVSITATNSGLTLRPTRVASATWVLALSDRRTDQSQIVTVLINEITIREGRTLVIQLCPGTYRLVPVIGGQQMPSQGRRLDVTGPAAPGCGLP